MLGYLRFVLAIFVILSHVNINFFNKNLGVFAVIIFYILAGYVTSKILLKVSPNNIRYFITDRFLRIYPAFFIISIITLIFLCITKLNNFSFDFFKIFLNFIIIPLNYFFYIDVSVLDNPIGINFILPPSWSLGAEIQAYILLVFGILYKKIGRFLAYFTLVVFIIAHLGYVNSDIFGYRLICGVFFIFYTGYLVYIKNYKKVILFVIVLLAVFLYSAYKNNFQIFTIETFCGYFFGVCIIVLHNFFKPKIVFNNFLGSMSYLIFLNHYPSMWMCQYFLSNQSFLCVFTISFVWAVILYLVMDRPLTKYRLKI